MKNMFRLPSALALVAGIGAACTAGHQTAAPAGAEASVTPSINTWQGLSTKEQEALKSKQLLSGFGGDFAKGFAQGAGAAAGAAAVTALVGELAPKPVVIAAVADKALDY